MLRTKSKLFQFCFCKSIELDVGNKIRISFVEEYLQNDRIIKLNRIQVVKVRCCFGIESHLNNLLKHQLITLYDYNS